MERLEESAAMRDALTENRGSSWISGNSGERLLQLRKARLASVRKLIQDLFSKLPHRKVSEQGRPGCRPRCSGHQHFLLVEAPQDGKSHLSPKAPE